jgi:hypothetical protein
LKENKSSTHYQVSIRAFFAESGAQTCANPRFEKALVLRPSVSIGQKVHAHHAALAPELGKAITHYISQNYPGPLNSGEMMSFADFKKRQSPKKMLNYASLQSNQLGAVDAALLISTDVTLRSGKRWGACNDFTFRHFGAKFDRGLFIKLADFGAPLPENALPNLKSFGCQIPGI